METAQAIRNNTQGYGFQYLKPRYIPFPTPPIQQRILAEKKAGVASIGKYQSTSTLKRQKAVQKQSF
jgi:hypothetical protein